MPIPPGLPRISGGGANGLDRGKFPGKNCNGRCDPRNGPFVSNDVYDKLTIHFAWANANECVILQREERSNQAAATIISAAARNDSPVYENRF